MSRKQRLSQPADVSGILPINGLKSTSDKHWCKNNAISGAIYIYDVNMNY